MKVLIAGGSGYIGRRLSVSLVKAGHDVIVLSRQPKSESPPSCVLYLTWDARSGDGGWVKELAGAQGIVNLAGATIGSWPWTRRRMAEMLSSRLSASAALVQALPRPPARMEDRLSPVPPPPPPLGGPPERRPAEGRPSVLISASGIDYYGDRG